MPRIAWVEDADATVPLAELYAAFQTMKETQGQVPDIARTMSHRPDFLRAVMEAGNLHFSEGALTRAQHEMIASYVSALSRCHY